MRILVKVRFSSPRGYIENVGRGLYILYLPFADSPDSVKNVSKILSKNIGVPFENIYFVEINSRGFWVFDLDKQ